MMLRENYLIIHSATNFYFCKPLAPNSIVISVITTKLRRVLPVEVIPSDKFSKLLSILQERWPSIKPYEMKFKLRSTGQRIDISHSEKTFAELSINNFSWLRVDFSHPDIIPVNV